MLWLVEPQQELQGKLNLDQPRTVTHNNSQPRGSRT